MKKLLFTVTLASLMGSVSAETTPEAKIAAFRAKAQKLVSQMTLAEKRTQLVNGASGIKRLGIPPYGWWNEALHGVARNGRATVFPQPIGQAASFNPDLIQQVAEAIVDEGRAKHAASLANRRTDSNTGLTYWSPNVNIFRDPRWGRGMETWGEDPFLTGVLGGAFVRGIQGDDPVYFKATACAKHFAVHSGPEPKRHSFNVNPSKKDLWETYLPAFETLVKDAKVQSVMSAYNAVYGESATSSEFLLKDILRKQWGFEGIVVSDCGAVSDIRGGHHLEKEREGSAARALNNGLTYECGGDLNALEGSVAHGLIKEEVIDAAVVDMLTTRYRLGILDDDPGCPYNKVNPDCVCSEEHRALARQLARESMVLLKNDRDALPIKLTNRQRRIAVNGSIAFDGFSLMGNYYGFSPNLVTYIEGIADALGNGLGLEYNPGYYYGKTGGASSTWAGGDVAIAFVGNVPLFEGEEGDAIGSPAGGDRTTMKLQEVQLEMLRRLNKSRPSYARLVTVVTGGSPVALKEVMELSDAVIFAWYSGEQGGNALADLLFGKADFTGRLPMTFPVDETVLPDFEDYSMKGRTYKYQTEGILFPFGYGLSLASASYEKVEVAADRASAQVTLKNAGKREAIETVQLYVATPNAGKGAPLASLAGFARVTVPAGQIVTATVPLANKYAFTEVTEEGTRVTPQGVYRVIAASAAPGARSAELGVRSCETTVQLVCQAD